jgi:hypothetical protein
MPISKYVSKAVCFLVVVQVKKTNRLIGSFRDQTVSTSHSGLARLGWFLKILSDRNSPANHVVIFCGA